MKKIKCLLGFHKWQYSYAPFKLMGEMGRVEAKICKICHYKSTKGLLKIKHLSEQHYERGY